MHFRHVLAFYDRDLARACLVERLILQPMRIRVSALGLFYSCRISNSTNLFFLIPYPSHLINLCPSSDIAFHFSAVRPLAVTGAARHQLKATNTINEDVISTDKTLNNGLPWCGVSSIMESKAQGHSHASLTQMALLGDCQSTCQTLNLQVTLPKGQALQRHGLVPRYL